MIVHSAVCIFLRHISCFLVTPQTMVALYDYSPEEQSPQDNPDSELPFKKGQMITVIGGMVRVVIT